MHEATLVSFEPKPVARQPWVVAGIASLALASGAGAASATEATTLTQSTVVECGPETPTDQLPILEYQEKPALTGSCVQYMQSLMVKHGHLAPSQVDGVFGPTTNGELKGFQVQNGIRHTGNAGPLTWPALRADTSNQGLPQVCLDMKRGACVSKDDRRTRLIKNGQVVASFASRFGDARGSEYRTDEGIFAVSRKERMSYSKEFNNAPMPYSVYYNRGEAFHYSPGFARDGYNGSSHGCVNLKLKASKVVFRTLKVGDRVVVY